MSHIHMYNTATAQQPASDSFFTQPPPLPKYDKHKHNINTVLNLQPVKSSMPQPDIIYKPITSSNHISASNTMTSTTQTSFITAPVVQPNKSYTNNKYDNCTAITLHNITQQKLYIYINGPNIPHALQYIPINYNPSYTIDDTINDIRAYTLIRTSITVQRNTPWQQSLQCNKTSVLSDDLYCTPNTTLTALFTDNQVVGVFEQLINISLPSGCQVNGNRTTQLTIQCTETVLQLKSKLYQLTQVPITEQKLVYNKNVLSDLHTLKYYSLKHGCTIQLVHIYTQHERSDGRPQLESITATHRDKTSCIQLHTGFIIKFAQRIGDITIPKLIIDPIHLINASCNGKLIPGTIKVMSDGYTVQFKPNHLLPLNSVVKVSVNAALVSNDYGTMKALHNSHTFHTITHAPIHLIITSPQLRQHQYTIVLLRSTSDLINELKTNIAANLGCDVLPSSITHIVYHNTLITTQQQIWALKHGDTIRIALSYTPKPLYIESNQYKHQSSHEHNHSNDSSLEESTQQPVNSTDSTDDEVTVDSRIHTPSNLSSANYIQHNLRTMLVKLVSNTSSSAFVKVQSTTHTIQQLVYDISNQLNQSNLVNQRLDILYYDSEFADYVLLTHINELPHSGIKLLVQIK